MTCYTITEIGIEAGNSKNLIITSKYLNIINRYVIVPITVIVLIKR